MPALELLARLLELGTAGLQPLPLPPGGHMELLDATALELLAMELEETAALELLGLELEETATLELLAMELEETAALELDVAGQVTS